MMFAMYFVVALVLGQLASRVRWQERAERRREERSTALYLLTRDLADAADVDDMAQRLVRQVAQAFNAKVAVLLREPGGGAGPHGASRQHVCRFRKGTKRRRVGFSLRQSGGAVHRQSALGRRDLRAAANQSRRGGRVGRGIGRATSSRPWNSAICWTPSRARPRWCWTGCGWTPRRNRRNWWRNRRN